MPGRTRPLRGRARRALQDDPRRQAHACARVDDRAFSSGARHRHARTRPRPCGQKGVMEPEPFELYLIRHGLAAERGEQYPDDTKRPLTTRGIQRLRRAGKALASLDVAFDVILTSPLVRTRQTADALASAFREPPPIVNAPSLAPGGSHNAIVDDLAKQHRRKKIAIVGHEPGIGELAA